MEVEEESTANAIRPEDSVSSVGLTAEAWRSRMEVEEESTANAIRPEDIVSSVGLTAALRSHNKRLRGHKWDPEEKPEFAKSSRAAQVAGPKPPDHPPPGFGNMSKAANVAKMNQKSKGIPAPKTGSAAKVPPAKAAPAAKASQAAPASMAAPEVKATPATPATPSAKVAPAAPLPPPAPPAPPLPPPPAPPAEVVPKTPPKASRSSEVSPKASSGLPRAFQSPARNAQYRMGDAGILERISTVAVGSVPAAAKSIMAVQLRALCKLRKRLELVCHHGLRPVLHVMGLQTLPSRSNSRPTGSTV